MDAEHPPHQDWFTRLVAGLFDWLGRVKDQAAATPDSAVPNRDGTPARDADEAAVVVGTEARRPTQYAYDETGCNPVQAPADRGGETWAFRYDPNDTRGREGVTDRIGIAFIPE